MGKVNWVCVYVLVLFAALV